MKKVLKKYLKATDLIFDAQFWMAGYGHFNVTREETALIIQMALKNDFDGLCKLYEKLSYERL